MATFRIETLGCKANTYDAASARQDLLRRGWRVAARGEAPDVVIVNSCTVTDAADRQSRRAARRLARRNPDATVVWTGCAAEVGAGGALLDQGVDLVVPNHDKASLADAAISAWAARRRGDATAPSPTLTPTLRPARHDNARPFAPVAARPPLADPAALGRRTRGLVKVQDGCDAFCTFCVIPHARGPSRSAPGDRVVDEVRGLVAAGVREVVLTGIALGDWGRDLSGGRDGDDALVALIERLLDETAVEGVRLGSLEPPEITPRLLDLMCREPRLRPHLHVSLQSPDARVLKRMGRRYGAADAVDCLARIAALEGPLWRAHGVAGGVYVGMDVIAGFPGEDAATFARTLEQLAALPWTRLHAFPYSERAGTAATRLDEVQPESARRVRVRALMALSLERQREVAERVVAAEAPLVVLTERPPTAARVHALGLEGGERRWHRGRAPNYHEIYFPTDGAATGERTSELSPPNTGVRVRPTRAVACERAGVVALVGERVGPLAR